MHIIQGPLLEMHNIKTVNACINDMAHLHSVRNWFDAHAYRMDPVIFFLFNSRWLIRLYICCRTLIDMFIMRRK